MFIFSDKSVCSNTILLHPVKNMDIVGITSAIFSEIFDSNWLTFQGVMQENEKLQKFSK